MGLLPIDAELLLDGFHSLIFVDIFQDQVGHQRRGWIQVHDAVGVDDQRAVAVRVEAQMDAALLTVVCVEVVMETSQWLMADSCFSRDDV